MEQMARHYVRVLEEVVSDSGQVIGEIDLLTRKEREQILVKWNEMAREYPRQKCVHELFEEQVERTPEAVAVVFEDQQVSYSELNRRANQLAHYLVRLGVRPDDRVAICLERSPEMVVGLLAILKAGGAYVPLDPVYPSDRLRFMIEDSGCIVLLTQSHPRLLVEVPSTLHVINLKDAVLWQNQSGSDLDCEKSGVNSNHLAYIIYTSGSTGSPKGVMVEHRNVVRLFSSTDKWFQFSREDVWTLFHSYSFDFSVWEMWGAL